MLDIVRTYIFTGVEHTEFDDAEVLWNDAVFVTEKIKGTSVNRCLKNSGMWRHTPNEAYEEIMEIITAHADYALHIECLSYEPVVEEVDNKWT